MRRTIIFLVTGLAVLAGACTAGSTSATTAIGREQNRTVTGVQAFAASTLQPFDSCNDFLRYVKKHAIERVGPYGLDGYGGYGDMWRDAPESMVSMDMAGATTTVAAGTATQGIEYSGTNVQVAGVDEPDVVKTDGERIFVVAQSRLFWIDTSGTPEIVASIPLDGWGQQIFLAGDSLLVMTSGGGYGPVPMMMDVAGDAIGPGYQTQRVVLTKVDISDPGSMEAVSTLMLDGSVLSSRMTGDTIRVVVRSGPNGFDWVYPEGNGIRAERKATEANKKLIEESTLENWVPWYVLSSHQTLVTSDGPVLGCDQVGHPDEFSGLSMLSVLSIDLEGDLEPGNSIGLMAEGETIYASSNNLYVATSPWMSWPAAKWEEGSVANQTLTTQIHMFDITDPDTATYVASGEVEGVLHSQWAMDEYKDVLRVVVTGENPWWGSSDVPVSAVVTLERRGDELVQIGFVDGLGKNERVYAVRFIQDKGYVVTFRQVDPLYVVDLSDPTNPQVKGELKINGYSAYLHPIGENLLLGIGQDATSEGRIEGTQISVFDVSDPSDPRRLSRLTFEDANSQAEWDHHAFLWWAPEGIAVLPLQRWSWDERSDKGESFSGAVVVTATPNRVKQVGEIKHPSVGSSECEGCEEWNAPINRSMVIGGTLFTFSEMGVLASNLETLDDIAWIPYS
ncbi:MAG: beta-propeller domain-containing protein [Actinomycetota bacterium]|nr:beta-propeller domain-containing protein [Actinomycetota bacterium]